MPPGFADHYSSIAGHYHRVRPEYPPELYDFLETTLPSGAPGRAWDVCTGNGQVAVALAGRGHAVVATDASAAQIAQAPAHGRVDYRVELAEQCSLEAGSVDLVVVAAGLHWLDVPRFFDEVRRVLRPGGVFAAWTYGTAFGMRGPMDDAVASVVEELGPWWPPEVHLGLEGYRSVRLPWTPGADRQFVVRGRWSRQRLMGVVRSWSASRRRARQHGREMSEGAERLLVNAWGDELHRPVALPVTLRWCRRPTTATPRFAS